MDWVRRCERDGDRLAGDQGRLKQVGGGVRVYAYTKRR
jgi:hypothetical protein